MILLVWQCRDPTDLPVCMHDGALCQIVEWETSGQWCMQAAEGVVSAVRQGGCPAVAVVGSKGVGKSTLARLLVNSLLEVSPVVAYLDTDCGQSELTVPGQYQYTLGRSGVQYAQSAFLHFLQECSCTLFGVTNMALSTLLS